jgi:microcystin-dependent protein
MVINLASNNMTSTFPIGTVVPIFFANSTSPPEGWLLCDGSEIPPNYTELAEKVPNGFLPDLRDYVLVGAGSSYTESQKIGVATHTIDETEMPSHQHFGVGSTYNNVNGFYESSSGSYRGFDGNKSGCYLWGTSFTGGTGIDGNGSGTGKIPTTNGKASYVFCGNNNPISLMQPSYAVNYYIYAGPYVVSVSQEKGNV